MLVQGLRGLSQSLFTFIKGYSRVAWGSRLVMTRQ